MLNAWVQLDENPYIEAIVWKRRHAECLEHSQLYTTHSTLLQMLYLDRREFGHPSQWTLSELTGMLHHKNSRGEKKKAAFHFTSK